MESIHMPILNLVPPIYYNVVQYGADPTGTIDSTTFIANARSAANAAGGGTVFWPAGTYLTNNQPVYASVLDLGAGPNVTFVKLINGANTDLFSGQTGSINLSASYGTGSAGTLYEFGWANMTLDGNKANQSSGTSYPIRVYGYGWTLHNVRIKNGYSGGVLSDWNGGAGLNAPNDATCYWYGVKIHDNNGIGLQWGGPHDSFFVNMDVYNSGTHGIHIAPNAAGMQMLNMQSFSNGATSIPLLIEASTGQYCAIQVAGSSVVEAVVLGGGNHFSQGRFFTNAGLASSGIQIGQTAGNTPYAGQILQAAGVTTAAVVSGCMIAGKIAGCTGTNGSLWLANDAGNNLFLLDIDNQLGGSYTTGGRGTGSFYLLNGTGVTNTGTFATSGGLLLQNNGFQSGTVRLQKSSTAPAIANNGTITTLGVGMARVAPTGNVTGIILQAGSSDGQVVLVVNQSAFTVTFDVSGTSQVASGTAAMIAAQTNSKFIYDTATSLWYSSVPIPLPYYNVRQYGCVVDGVTDDSTAFTAAYTATGATGGVLTGFNGGTLVKGNDTLLSNVTIDGQGGTIKLKNGANTDLFSAQTGSINLSAAVGTGATGTLSGFCLKDITLDGNKANQSSGTSYPLRFYGYGYTMQNVRIKNGYTGGILSDWNGSGVPAPDSMESQWSNIKIHDNNGIGLQIGGPHDTQFSNIIIYNSGSHNLHIAPNCAGAQFLNLHSWSPGDVGALVEAGYCLFANSVSEGSNTMNVALLASVISWQGSIFEGSVGNGIQFGQTSGNTPYAGQIQQSAGVTTTVFCGGCIIDSLFENCTSSHGAIWFANDGGNNVIKASIYQTSGNAVTGTPSSNTSYQITVNGLTADGTLAKSGGSRAANAMQVSNASSIFSGSGAPSGGANGDYYLRTDTPGTANQRLYVKSAGTWVGIL
jgi:hypothetical protein